MAKSGSPSKVATGSTERSANTRRLLVDAAIETLRDHGFAGASARAISERAGQNQGLVFYHFGSVANLLLAALDAVSDDRMVRFSAAVENVSSPNELMDVAAQIFREDLDTGHVTVLVEMIAGASSTPGLGAEVATRIGPWFTFTKDAIDKTFGDSPFASLLLPDDVAYTIVALFLGLAMLTHLDAARERALTDSGRQVRTLTGHPNRATGASPIEIRPLDFDDQIGLVASLEGVTTLYNTYWVRFAHQRIDLDLAVENSRALFQAARRAGVERIVHVSITHPSVDSPLPYFRGKALVERALAETGVSYAVLRPAILFGGDGVLLNNIAWLLRRLPVFAVGGRGDYRIRGIHIDDLAQLCLTKGAERDDSVIDAVGPERPTFIELVQ